MRQFIAWFSKLLFKFLQNVFGKIKVVKHSLKVATQLRWLNSDLVVHRTTRSLCLSVSLWALLHFNKSSFSTSHKQRARWLCSLVCDRPGEMVLFGFLPGSFCLRLILSLPQASFSPSLFPAPKASKYLTWCPFAEGNKKTSALSCTSSASKTGLFLMDQIKYDLFRSTARLLHWHRSV